jgi:hypothetical protein
MKKTYSALLAVLLLALFGASSQAQTTNFVIYNFNTNQVAQQPGFPFGGAYQGWGNWFGPAFVSDAWDPTMDSSNNPLSGALEVNTKWLPATNGNYYQYVEFDGFSSDNLDMFNTFTNISFDIKYAASSCTRTNADGSVDFGNMRFGAFDAFNQDWIQYFAIPATNGLGQPNTNWTHISVSINTNTFATYPNLTTISGLLFGMDGGYPALGNTNLSGTQTYWIDNIEAIGPLGGIVHPPPIMGLQKAIPALRVFLGSASIYARSQLTTVAANQAWVGGTFPKTYSFTLSDFPNVNQVQAQLEFIPGAAYTGNAGADYGNATTAWLQILSDGAGGYTADIAWKTNAANHNPNDGTYGHTELSIVRTNSPAGTWTLTFNSNTSGTLSAPGTNNATFAINDANVATDFGNPCTLVVGNMPNGIQQAEGLPSDYTQISVTGTAGGPINDNFTTAQTIDPVWTLANSDNTNTTQLVTTNTPYWVTWTSPAQNFGLGISPDLTNDLDWHLPAYYNGFAGDPPAVTLNGTKYWVLIPNQDLPSYPAIDGNPSPSTNGVTFFRVSNPPPSN